MKNENCNVHIDVNNAPVEVSNTTVTARWFMLYLHLALLLWLNIITERETQKLDDAL